MLCRYHPKNGIVQIHSGCIVNPNLAKFVPEFAHPVFLLGTSTSTRDMIFLQAPSSHEQAMAA